MPFFGGNSGGDYKILLNDNISGGNGVLSINTGISNIALGNVALSQNTTGRFNLAVGTGALEFNSTGQQNTAVGYNSGFSSSDGMTNSDNAFFGFESGANLTDGSNQNTCVGSLAGSASQFQKYTECTFIGYSAGYCGSLSTTPDFLNCIGIGQFAGSVIGNVGPPNQPNFRNNTIFIGNGNGGWTNSSHAGVLTGTVGIGHGGCKKQGSGAFIANNAVFIGYQSGFVNSGATSINADNAILIGGNAAALINGAQLTNTIAIGHDIVPTGINQIRVGNTQTDVLIGAYNLATIAGGGGLSATWAALPAANSVTTGTIYRVTDIGVGGSHWYSDGARWRSIGGKVNLFEMQTPVTSNGTNVEAIVQQFGPLPANFFYTGDKLHVEILGLESAMIDTNFTFCRIGPLGTKSDPYVYYAQSPSNVSIVSLFGGLKFLSGTSSKTIYGDISSSNTPFGNGVDPPFVTTIDKSLAQFISITSKMFVGGLSTITYSKISVYLETVGA